VRYSLPLSIKTGSIRLSKNPAGSPKAEFLTETDTAGQPSHSIRIHRPGSSRVYQMRSASEAETLEWFNQIERSIHSGEDGYEFSYYDPRGVVPRGKHGWLANETGWLQWGSACSSSREGYEAYKSLVDNEVSSSSTTAV